MPKNQQKD